MSEQYRCRACLSKDPEHACPFKGVPGRDPDVPLSAEAREGWAALGKLLEKPAKQRLRLPGDGGEWDWLIPGRAEVLGRPISYPEWVEADPRFDAWDRAVLAIHVEAGATESEPALVTDQYLLKRIRGNTIPSEIEHIRRARIRLLQLGALCRNEDGDWYVAPTNAEAPPPKLSFYEECRVMAWQMAEPEHQRILLEVLEQVEKDEERNRGPR